MRDYFVYLAGPISGLTYLRATNWRVWVAEDLAPEITALSPMRGKGRLERAGVIRGTYEKQVLTSRRGIVARDRYDVQRCDAVLVNLLSAQTISQGTLWEIAWADAWGKPVVVAMETLGNPNNHAFLRERVPYITPSLVEAVRLVRAILLPSGE